jgi:hypothetical protein
MSQQQIKAWACQAHHCPRPSCRACGVGRVKDQGYVKRRANCLLLIRRLLCRCCVLLACCKQAGCHRPAYRLRQAD